MPGDHGLQVIDDTVGHTLVATSTLSPDLKGQLGEETGADTVVS